MTWKSTAAASGVMLVGTWLASYAPVGGPRSQQAPVPPVAHTESVAADIQREADRLHGRMQQVAAYRLPARNPFRFAERAAKPIAPSRPSIAVEPTAPVVETAPAMSLVLSGVAEDGVGEELVRTAIIATPDDVHLVKIGETISGTYKVTKIAAEGVELVRLDDGSTVQLTLKP